MPKQITDIRDFLQKARRTDAALVKIRKRDSQTKFKIRCSRHLYTLVVTEVDAKSTTRAQERNNLEMKNHVAAAAAASISIFL
jgi:large subunit ribosomal protein L38e